MRLGGFETDAARLRQRDATESGEWERGQLGSSLLESMPVPAVLVTAEGEITAASPSFVDVSGLHAPIGRSLPSLLDPGGAAVVGTALATGVNADRLERDRGVRVTLLATGRQHDLRLGPPIRSGYGSLRLALLLPSGQRETAANGRGMPRLYRYNLLIINHVGTRHAVSGYA